MAKRHRPLMEDEGSALPTVLFLTVVVSALVGAMVLTHLAERRLIARDALRQQAQYAAEGGIHDALRQLADADLRFADGTDLDDIASSTSPSDSSQSPPEVIAQAFGAWVRISSTAERGSAQARVIATVGKAPPEAMDAALVYGGNDVLTFAGSVSVIGNVEVGETGTTTGSLRGRPYSGVVDSDITRRSSSPLPAFDDATFRETLERHAGYLASLPEELTASPARWSDPPLDLVEAESPFVDSLRVYTVGPGGVVALAEWGEAPVLVLASGDVSVEGPLPRGSQIVATGTVTLTPDAEGADLLVTADRIQVSGPTRLQGQLLARRGLVADGGATLSYPSVLFVQGETVVSERDRLELAETTVEGLVLTSPGTRPLLAGELAGVVIGRDAVVRGAVYAGRRADVTGRVEGTLLAREFSFYESPATYVNWIADAILDRDRRPESMVVPAGLGRAGSYQILMQDAQVIRGVK